MLESLGNITLKELIQYIVGIMAVISILVERSNSLPFKPWSKLIQWIGSALNKQLSVDIKELQKQTKANNDAIIKLDKKMEEKFEETARSADVKEAKKLRASIICFSDACRVGTHHTKTHFENIFRDIDDYKEYCANRKIPNHYIDGEVAYITEVYEYCLKENKFI